RFDWYKQSQTDALHCRGTSRHRQAGYISDIAVQHVRSANQVSRHSGRLCNSVQEDALDHADPHLSQHHSSKKFRLDWGGLGENGLEEAHLPVSRLRPGCFGDSLKRIVDVAYRQRMLGEPLLSEVLAGVRHCSVADFQDTRVRLGKCFSSKKQCSQRNLFATNRLQEGADQSNLLVPLGSSLDPPTKLSQF